MVRVGILCEGESETYILKSAGFQEWLERHGLDLVGIRVVGSKNQYWDDRLTAHMEILNDLGVDHIIILVDLDDDTCITRTKEVIKNPEGSSVIVCVKEFESWYLADSLAISKVVGENVTVESPEEFEEPVAKIISLNHGRGFSGSKPRLAMKMRNSGFSIENAAKHPACPSALYFLNRLKQIAAEQ
jgi:hypothetical protein